MLYQRSAWPLLPLVAIRHVQCLVWAKKRLRYLWRTSLLWTTARMPQEIQTPFSSRDRNIVQQYVKIKRLITQESCHDYYLSIFTESWGFSCCLTYRMTKRIILVAEENWYRLSGLELIAAGLTEISIETTTTTWYFQTAQAMQDLPTRVSKCTSIIAHSTAYCCCITLSQGRNWVWIQVRVFASESYTQIQRTKNSPKSSEYKRWPCQL